MGITFKSPKLSQKKKGNYPWWNLAATDFAAVLRNDPPLLHSLKNSIKKKKSVFHFEMKIFYVLQKQTDNIFGWNTQSAAGHTREMQRAGSSQPSLKALTASTRA